jgi:hypothetical protein
LVFFRTRGDSKRHTQISIASIWVHLKLHCGTPPTRQQL